MLHDCKTVAVKVSLLPATCSVLGPSVEVDDLQGVTVPGINPPVLARASRTVKRGLDLVRVGVAILGVSVPLRNVLKGDLSLRGPCPLTAEEDRMVDDGAQRLMDLTPWMTGAVAAAGGAASQRSELMTPPSPRHVWASLVWMSRCRTVTG